MQEFNLNCKYTYWVQFGSIKHQWECIGGAGGIHLHISIYKGILYSEKEDETYSESAGIEYHYRIPPFNKHDAPSQSNCWLLKTPCWHAGSSLYAEEVFLPYWKNSPHDHDGMFRKLKVEYNRVFINSQESN